MQPFLASAFPQKLVTGDYNKDSSEIVSSHTWSDWSGGIGLENWRGDADSTRCFTSQCDTRAPGHLTLPALVTNTDDANSPAQTPVVLLAQGGFIYAAFDNGATSPVHRYDGSWSTSVVTLAGVPRRGLVARLGSTVWVIIVDGVQVNYTTNGTTWYADTQVAPTQIAFWDERIWVMNNSCQLYSTTELNTTPGNNGWATRGQPLPLPDGYPTGLLVGPDAAGEPTLYAVTRSGLWVYDLDNDRWLQTALQFPPITADVNPGLTYGSNVWRGKIYVGGEGLQLFEYAPQEGVVRNIGFGLPSFNLPQSFRGRIGQIAPSFMDLIVSINGEYEGGDQGGATLGWIGAWNGEAWRVLYQGISNANLHAILATPEVSAYRLYFGLGNVTPAADVGVYYMLLPLDAASPKETTSYTYYGSSRTHVTPWFDGGWSEINKLALRCWVGTLDVTSTQTVQIEYALDGSSTYTSLGTVTSQPASGRTELEFPDSTTPTGTVFRKIRFRVTLVRGSTNTTSPDMTYLTLEYVKNPTVVYGWNAVLDVGGSYKARSPMQQMANIRTAISSGTLVECTFRDDTGDTRNYYVKVRVARGQEESGHNEEGQFHVELVGLNSIA